MHVRESRRDFSSPNLSVVATPLYPLRHLPLSNHFLTHCSVSQVLAALRETRHDPGIRGQAGIHGQARERAFRSHHASSRCKLERDVRGGEDHFTETSMKTPQRVQCPERAVGRCFNGHPVFTDVAEPDAYTLSGERVADAPKRVVQGDLTCCLISTRGFLLRWQAGCAVHIHQLYSTPHCERTTFVR